MTTFTIPAVPVAQPRQRMAMIAGRPQSYTPTKHPVNAFKAAARLAYAKRVNDAPAEGPVALAVTFFMPRPKNKQWKTKPMPRYEHVKKPDIDNLAKSVLDALNGLAWRDDSQIHMLTVSKVVAAGDEQPHVLVSITGAGA